MDGAYHHLALFEWPFSVVPRPELCTFVAGRPTLDSDISDLLQNLSRRDTSSIHVFWSWFGAGKTHSLYYLANRATKINDRQSRIQLRPLYSEFPKSAKNFVDLYRAFANSMNLQTFADAFLELGTSPQQQLFYEELLLRNPDLAASLRNLLSGSLPDRTTASRWLRGDQLPLSAFRRIGVTQGIRTSQLATQTLASLLNLLATAQKSCSGQGHRLIWLIDEFQRIQDTGSKSILDINAGLHSLFNMCPSGLSLVLSFSGQPDPKSLPQWFSPEMKDRMGVTKVILLPPFSRTEALNFVKDVLTHFRLPRHSESVLYPFTPDSCETIIDYLEENGNLRPRFVMDAFNVVLEKADALIEGGHISSISAEFANDALKEHMILSGREE